MDSVGPMTRSRARATGAPATPAIPTTTVTPTSRRSTRRTRAASAKEVPVAPEGPAMQLFPDVEEPTSADTPIEPQPASAEHVVLAEEDATTDTQNNSAQPLEPASPASAETSAPVLDAVWHDSQTDFSIVGIVTPAPGAAALAPKVQTPQPAAAVPEADGTATTASEPGVVDFLLSPEAAKQGNRFEQDLAEADAELHATEDVDSMMLASPAAATPGVPTTPADFSFDVAIPEPAADADDDKSTPTLLTPSREPSTDMVAAGFTPLRNNTPSPSHATYVVTSDAVNLSHTPAFTFTTAADFIDPETPLELPAQKTPIADFHVGHIFEGFNSNAEGADDMEDASDLEQGSPAPAAPASPSLAGDVADAAMSEAASPAFSPSLATPQIVSNATPLAQGAGFFASPAAGASASRSAAQMLGMLPSPPVAPEMTAEEAAEAFASFADYEEDLDFSPLQTTPEQSIAAVEQNADAASLPAFQLDDEHVFDNTDTTMQQGLPDVSSPAAFSVEQPAADTMMDDSTDSVLDEAAPDAMASPLASLPVEDTEPELSNASVAIDAAMESDASESGSTPSSPTDLSAGSLPAASTPKAATPASMARTVRTPATAPAGRSAAGFTTSAKTPATAKVPSKTAAAVKPVPVSPATENMLNALSDISGKATNRPVASYMKPTAASSAKQAKTKTTAENVGPAPVSKPKLKSMVVAPESYDDRSLRRLRKDIKAAEQRVKKAAAEVQVHDANQIRKTPANEQDWEYEASVATVDIADDSDGEEVQGGLAQTAEDELTSQMGQLGIKKAPLRGLPAPQGNHIRFGENLTPIASPSNGKVFLRGVPAAQGRHIRFDE